MSKDPHQREHILSYAAPTTLIGGSLLFVLYIAFLQATLWRYFIAIIHFNLYWSNRNYFATTLYFTNHGILSSWEKPPVHSSFTIFPLGATNVVAIGILISSTTEPLLIFMALWLWHY